MENEETDQNHTRISNKLNRNKPLQLNFLSKRKNNKTNEIKNKNKIKNHEHQFISSTLSSGWIISIS